MSSDLVSFTTYRPIYHFIAPHSWMNDPCGAVYIPELKEYILCYQWHPGSAAAGNSAWGMARSKDLITWTDCAPALRTGPASSYDSHGVFSGSLVSRLVDGNRLLYLFYTSISALPIHWSKPYIAGCESQSLAFSTDLGRSWHRYHQNPLLTEPRHQSQTTGWRDPYVATWPLLSSLRGAGPDTNYMLTSSGKRGSGPELVLYESPDLLSWTPLCVLFKAAADTPITPDRRSMRHGRNFECASFFTLAGKAYILAGVEAHPNHTDRHSARYTLWMCGRLQLDSHGRPVFVPESHGTLDHGILYAPHIFRGARGELLLSGWADEDDEELGIKQGWAGCVTLPRELFVLERPLREANGNADDHVWARDKATGTMTTLGVRPAHHLRGLRSGSMIYPLAALWQMRSKSYELEARLANPSGLETLVFNVRQAPGDEEVTRIVFALATQSVLVDRSRSSLRVGNRSVEKGDFVLGEGEDLHIRVFVDNSTVEVFANGRFAMVSRVYPVLESAVGASCLFTGADGKEVDTGVWVQCWEGLGEAWPERRRGEEGIEEALGEMEIGGEEDAEWEYEEEPSEGEGVDMEMEIERETKIEREAEIEMETEIERDTEMEMKVQGRDVSGMAVAA
jgi:beta-fructofuranosidase